MNDIPSSDAGFGSAHDPFGAAKASAMKAAEELRAAAAQKATELRQAAEQRVQQFKSAAEQKAEEFKTAAGQKAGELREKAHEFRSYADDTIDGARQRYETFMTDAERVTREKPRQALLTAFGIGVVIGFLLRR